MVPCTLKMNQTPYFTMNILLQIQMFSIQKDFHSMQKDYDFHLSFELSQLMKDFFTFLWNYIKLWVILKRPFRSTLEMHDRVFQAISVTCTCYVLFRYRIKLFRFFCDCSHCCILAETSFPSIFHYPFHLYNYSFDACYLRWSHFGNIWLHLLFMILWFFVYSPCLIFHPRFSLWNTMMGTSLLTMPWAIKEVWIVPRLIMVQRVIFWLHSLIVWYMLCQDLWDPS